MINKVLIANRSEIACRIIKACKEMNIKTVAVYSDIDSDSLHVQLADESYNLPGEKAGDTYLNQELIIKAAMETEAGAIHPGYGFLSENYEFNQKVRYAGLIFIGPHPKAVEILGSKLESRKLMIENNVPVTPGMTSDSENINDYLEKAEEIGYPVLIKASAGGGGKGMRIANDADELKEAVPAARRESISAFDSDKIYLEKYIVQPRHIEFQVAGDKKGNYLHFYERECSIQRRHQKIIEETPSTALDNETRQKMADAAVNAIKSVDYDSVGTVEFLLDKDNNFYFLEVNTRIQVEHPITEETTGIDLIKLQIEIADGQAIPYEQEEISQSGHSIECRVYAEDPENNFMPSSGKILFYKEAKAPGVRIDTGISQGNEVSVFYDPILAKIIVKAEDREMAISRMIYALRNTIILGVKTTIPYMIKVLENENFIKGNTTTDFIEKNNIITDYNNKKIALAAAESFENNKTEKNNIDNPEKNDVWEMIGKWEILSNN